MWANPSHFDIRSLIARATISYEKAESLQQVFTEVNEDFERAMKTSRAEAIWIATHVHADQDTSLFAIQDSSRRRRFDIGVRFDMRACKRSLGAVNRRLRYTNLVSFVRHQV